MARPKSYGIDYFTFNVDFFEDPKLLFVANRFEEKGELITVKLLCWIFKNQGYYMEWNDELAMLFSKRAFVNIKYSLVNDVVNELIKREFFNRQMFNSFGILTSNGIQKRWVEATKRRTVKIKSKYNCIDKDTETPITDTEKKAEPPEIPQSRVEYSKVKESKEEKYINTRVYTEEDFLKRWKAARIFYDKKPTNIKKLKTNDSSVFKDLAKEYSAKEFDDAIGGLFFQKTYLATRVQPTHFLENFETYLDCWINKEKLYEEKKRKKEML